MAKKVLELNVDFKDQAKSGDLGSPIGQQHLCRSQSAKVKGDNFLRLGSKGLSDLTIGDCRLGNPIRCTLPTTAFLVTPNFNPICVIDKP